MVREPADLLLRRVPLPLKMYAIPQRLSTGPDFDGALHRYNPPVHVLRPSSPAARRAPAYLAGGVAILGLAFWLRLAQLYSLPVFVDEAHHLVKAHLFAIGQPRYALLMDGKFLLGAFLALFQPQGPAVLWQGRAAEAVVSLLSCSVCIALGRQLHSSRAGLLAGLLYALLPYAVFHDRQVLADPLMAHFGAVGLFLALQLARTRRRWLIWPLAAALGAAFAAKLTGIAYLFPLGLAVLLLPASVKARWTLLRRYLAAVGLAAVLVAIFFLSFRSLWGVNDGTFVEQNVGFIGCPPLLCQGDWARQLYEWQSAGAVLLDFLPRYFGWPLLALAALAGLAQPRGRRGPVVFLLLMTIGMSAALLALAKGVPRTPLSQGVCGQLAPTLEAAALAAFPPLISLPPRYYSTVSVPLAVLGALGLVGLARMAARRWPRGGQTAWLGVITLIALIPFANSALIILDPAQADLPVVDRWQYFAGPYAGPGFREAALAIQAQTAPPAQPGVVLIQDIYEYVRSISFVFDPARALAVGVADREKDWTKALGLATLSSSNVYLVDETTPSQVACSLVPALSVANTSLFPRDGGLRQLRLQKVGPVGAPLRAQFFTTLFTPPDQIPDAYRGLAGTLLGTFPGSPGETVVLAYPPNQAALLGQVLANNPHLKVYPIGDAWPLDQAALEAELAARTAAAASVKVVFLEEQQGDPQRSIETWLNTHLFRVGEQWFTPLRLVDFAGAGQPPQAIDANIQFGDHIVLETVQVLDSAAQAGGLVRVRLAWRTDAAIDQPLKTFAHLVGDAGIVAQHDGQPVGELRPTTTWQANERVVDQFALRLPPDVLAGAYELRIGLYDRDTLVRLPARLPGGALQEYYVAGKIVIR
jgi:4-amino-4-deoxy-L-arabinose transferase-like glycosyltransferase